MKPSDKSLGYFRLALRGILISVPKSDQAYTTTYTYDAYNRLTQATASAYTRYYAHDAWGNISNFSSTTFSYATNASGSPATNRIATATNGQGTVGLSYDAAGNLTQDGSAVYNYDAANRLKEVGVGGSNTYGYDGDGMRVRQSSGGAAMFYVRSSVLKNVAMEVTATGGAVRAYVQAGNKTVAMSSRDGQFYWLHTNHLNSSRAMTDINGTLVYKGQYDPYGKALLEWSATNDTGLNTRKFTGYERDATGLDYANARTYASERGRFIQPDPIGIGGARLEQPQSMNRYAYVQNDPINFVDKSGLLLESPDGISGSGSDCQSIFVAVDWSSSDGPTGTGVLSYGFTYRSCVTSSGGSSVGGTDLPSYQEILLGYMDKLLSNKDCVAAIGEEKINKWKAHVANGDVKIYHNSSNAVIPKKGGQTVSQYWNKFWYWGPNGATVISGATFDINGRPQRDGNFSDARKYNTIIINTLDNIDQIELTLMHEFMHWEVSGNHIAIADEDHLDLRRFGYENLRDDNAASSAINEFFKNGCK